MSFGSNRAIRPGDGDAIPGARCDIGAYELNADIRCENGPSSRDLDPARLPLIVKKDGLDGLEVSWEPLSLVHRAIIIEIPVHLAGVHAQTQPSGTVVASETFSAAWVAPALRADDPSIVDDQGLVESCLGH